MNDCALRQALGAFGVQGVQVLHEGEASSVLLGSRGLDRVVLKIQRDRGLVANALSAVAAQQRAAASGLAPPALPTRDGEHVLRIGSEAVTASLYAGNHESPRFRDPRRMGTLAGELHVALNRVDPPPGCRSIDGTVTLEDARSLPVADGLRGDRDVRLSILERRRSGAASDSRRRLLHGDLWIENVVMAGDRWVVVDFDRAAEGPIEYEVVRAFFASFNVRARRTDVFEDLKRYYDAYTAVAGHLIASRSFEDLLVAFVGISASDFTGLAPSAGEARRAYAQLVTGRLAWIDRHWETLIDSVDN